MGGGDSQDLTAAAVSSERGLKEFELASQLFCLPLRLPRTRIQHTAQDA